MPRPGWRFNDNAEVTSVGSYGNYWSSIPKDVNNAYIMYVSSSYIGPQNYNVRTNGFSIRPFKNEVVIPDYNDIWDTLY